MTPDRFCPTCQRWKQPHYFGPRGTGLSRDCKACYSARIIRFRQLQKARILAQSATIEATIGPGFPGVDIDRIHHKLGKVRKTLRRSKSNHRLN